MAKTNAERVQQRRDKLRAAGLAQCRSGYQTPVRPASREMRRQCQMIAAAEDTPEAREEAASGKPPRLTPGTASIDAAW